MRNPTKTAQMNLSIEKLVVFVGESFDLIKRNDFLQIISNNKFYKRKTTQFERIKVTVSYVVPETTKTFGDLTVITTPFKNDKLWKIVAWILCYQICHFSYQLFSILHIMRGRNTGYYYRIILEINGHDERVYVGLYVKHTKGAPKFKPTISERD